MVTARPWNANALARLVLCLIVCFFCGLLLAGLLHHASAGAKADARFYRLITSALGCAAAALGFVYRPWTNETLPSRLGGYLVCLYGGILLWAWASKRSESNGPSMSQMIIAVLSFQGAALVLISHFLKEQQTTWTEAFGFRNNRKQSIMLGVILACLFLPLGIGLQWLSALVMMHFPGVHIKPEQQESVQTLELAVTWFHRMVLGAATILIAPPAEEMLFRGILYPAIKYAGFPRFALWGSALFFAAIHMNLVTFVPLLVLALALTLVYERTDNLLAPIAAHAMFNAMNFAILYSPFGPVQPS